jgi:cell division septum initiation protein DivIVA
MPDHDTFRVVLRGYEPAQVNERINELTQLAVQARAQRDALAAKLEAAERALAEARSAPTTAEAAPAITEPPTFEHLGARVGQILTLANQEADDLRRRAEADIAALRRQLDEEAEATREKAERFAAETRSAAEAEATRIVADARRTADQRIDKAERDATARIQAAEAMHEEQRTRAVKAAADFESTLAERRKVAEDEFQRQMDEVQDRLDEARQTLEKARADARQTEDDAKAEARRLVDSAEQDAPRSLDDARTATARMRAESERERAAATQRRNAINAQLGNVREMLATLTGSVAPADIPDVVDVVEDPADDDATDGQ